MTISLPNNNNKKIITRDFPVMQWLGSFQCRGCRLDPWLGPRSHMPLGQRTKHKIEAMLYVQIQQDLKKKRYTSEKS